MTMELVYTPTREDVADAVRVQLRYGSFRVLRWLMPVAAVLAFVAVALLLTGPGEPDVGGAVLMGSLGLLTVVLRPLAARLTARQMYAMIARQGEHRARVDEDGIRWTTRDSEVTARWQLTPRYAETSTQFVLFSGDKGRAGIAALPKRGLTDPGDVDRLRTVLDRNITRL
ncbi:YcxB family protein [Streptomyces sp. NPDC048623]|uniref:YcxB family protein n=1 Tax=Streptomyces sp. NPDC048623 TaxID=3155761 RepID=UPI003447514B